MAYELYQVLGVGPRATPEEIRRAYYRQVRTHSPESDPEGFKAIRSAYETLSDSEARRNYDALQEHGDELARLFAEAEQAIGASDYDRAIRLLRRLLALAPGTDAARNTLGLCYLKVQRWADAIKVFRWLTQKHSDVPLYWLNLGYCYSEQASAMEAPGPRRSRLFSDARECFKKAAELESFNAEPYLAVARTYADEEAYPEAIGWAERAVAADGKADFQDFEALFFTCIINVRRNALGEVAKTAERIMSILPDDVEVRKFVAARFAVLGQHLCQAKAYRHAVVFLRHARDLDPDSPQIAKIFRICSAIVRATDSYRAFMGDPAVAEPFKRFVTLYLAEAFGEPIPDRERVFNEILQLIVILPIHSVLSSLERIRTEYPGIYEMSEDFFRHIEAVARRALAAQPATTRTTSAGTGTGAPCFVVTATYGTPYAPEVERYRAFRDDYLLRTPAGRVLVHAYYVIGPALARLVRMSPALRRVTAAFLGWLARRLPSRRCGV